jgi:hypothetical protein
MGKLRRRLEEGDEGKKKLKNKTERAPKKFEEEMMKRDFPSENL